MQSSTRHVETWFLATPVAWLVTFVAVMVGAEALMRRRRGLRGDPVDTATSLALGVTYLVVKVIGARLAFIGLAFWIYDHLRIFTIPVTPLAWFGAYLVGDFVYYWVHRSEHRFSILWSSHLVHHSSEEFTFTTAVRNPWTEIAYKPLMGLWAPLLGVHPLMAASLGTVGLMVGLLQHTALVDGLGQLDKVFMTPRNHRVHHASNREYLDTNFGGTLLVWDRMFGTFAAETTPLVYGITKPLASRDPWTVGLGGYPDLLARTRAASGPERLAVLFARP